ncbi:MULTISPECIES: rhamnulokinase [Enterococcus]|uniref:Rhamnulokinase n=1 Tax=Enterococcus malodoratus ATCC 43197 TaxID=1158601 RepID=R2RNM5_9ENTE|nr:MULTISPECIES: rhamnulokinase [Enterococcus]EOH77579.1 rhamnulokinase [Enterococcus malodoratus ATCC 43197]EOT64007.1 rhamnulokinase [Enterococcus malodoratus ATCC 43197]SPX00990.1 rhamnulokinase [Enterococcus malodoratus]STD66063.1 rhamnulokinase [Enterococcus malodoratus]HCM85108.1 rhamnulokinase [Enterococcus sp.]
MTETYIAVDIGASSGRLMLSEKNPFNKISLEEVHRFKNGFSDNSGTDYWNADHLIEEILIGLEKVKQRGVEKCYVGIDTWGVDYCLLDKQGQALSQPVSYRDDRTKQAMEEFDQQFSLQMLYQKTGIQLQPFNTVFQLFKEDREKLAHAKQLLLMPDYLGYVLTGQAVLEKTNASTMQLMNLKSRKLDEDVLTAIDVVKELFPNPVEPGTILGPILKEKFPTYDLPDATFITIASHDTASAVVGTPGKGDNWAYISSGTWSLMGVEIEEGISTPEAFEANFTNEWGVQGTIRFLKNIMGMWLIQEVARMQDYQYSYPELAELASQEEAFVSLIDVNDSRFMNPKNMITEIQSYCREVDQKIPKTAGELARCIYDSLALCYAVELEKLEKITDRTITQLHIVGGGSNNDFLNQLTADACGINVLAGPGEATAIGNIIVQMVATKGFGTLAEGREGIKKSFPMKEFQPQIDNQCAIEKYQSLTKSFV